MASFVTIELLRKSFANFGITDTIVSGNAPNLISNEMREFHLKNGINLINPSPFILLLTDWLKEVSELLRRELKNCKVGHSILNFVDFCTLTVEPFIA